MAPVVAVNVPDASRAAAHGLRRQARVGRPSDARHLRDGRRSGNRRRAARSARRDCCSSTARTGWPGYLGEPELTQQALRDGWYVTGDIATIDEDGFIRITDRLSRFSKIAGEMVPHMKIEEATAGAAAAIRTSCVVTAVPDAAKGERLVALYTRSRPHAAGDLGAAVASRICRSSGCRSARIIRFVESIPTLGTGKVDLRAVRRSGIDRGPSDVKALQQTF